jgi:alpha-1,2-mannosyltransferase
VSNSSAPLLWPQYGGFPGRVLPRPALRSARAALVVANVAAVTFFLLSFRHGIGFGPYREDLEVYRQGGRIWLHGGDLYRQPRAPSGRLRLPFTYPPIAAVLFSPLSLLPTVVDVTGLTLVSILAAGVVLWLFARRLLGPRSTSLWVVAWLLPVALFIEPVRNDLWLGQINLLLMALVSLDCLTEAPRWPRGVLVGLAAAVKLIPLAFVLFFLLRRDYRAAGRAAATAAVVTGIGFLLAWHDSVRYWTAVVLDTSRIGGLAYAGNQSIQAVLARAGLDPHSVAATAGWLALSALVLAGACLGMRRAVAAEADCWALSLNAFAALLISPISWTHHWVWCAPAIATLLILGLRNRSRVWLATALAGLVIFAAGPQWWFPAGAGRELHWAVWQQVVGSSYVLYAVAVLGLSACAGIAGPRGSAAELESGTAAAGPPDDQLDGQTVGA